MAFFRRTFSRRLLPDRFQEISERLYVFDCCLSSKELREQDYKSYMDSAVSNLQKYHPGASFMVFNFKEGNDPSLISDILSHYDMTVVDYPRDYQGYPILPLEMIHYFLRSSDSWLSLEGQRNVILMHCERGCWPVLAFMLAGFLLYNKKQSVEHKTLDMVYNYAPKELLVPISSINPRPSQLRYLHYISSRSSTTSDWPPSDAPMVIESLLLMNLPLFDGGKGCRPVVHIYGQDPSVKRNGIPRLLYSSLMSEDGARFYHKEECLLVKINVNCRVQGDMFLECIHLGEDLVSETKIFKAMFHTAFVQSYILLLTSSEVDVLWNADSRIPEDLKAQVFFSNPQEVQLSAAKEVTVVEEGHESETEFFESQEDLVLENNETLQFNEVIQEKLEVQSSAVAVDNQTRNLEASFDDEAKDEETVVSQGLSLDAAAICDEASAANANIIIQNPTGLAVSSSEEEYNSEQTIETGDVKNADILVDVVKTSQPVASSEIIYEANEKIVTENFLLLEASLEDNSSSEAQSEPNIVVVAEDDPKTYAVELRAEPIILSTKAVATQGSEEDDSETYPIELRFEPIVVSTNTMVTQGSEEDDLKTYPVELISEPIVVSTNTVAIEGSEDGSVTVVAEDRSLTVQGSQDYAEANLIEKKYVTVQGREEESSGSESNFEVLEESRQVASSGVICEANEKIVTDNFLLLDAILEDSSSSEAQSEPNIVVVEQGDRKIYPIELRSEPIVVSTNTVATEEDDPKTYPIELRSEPITVSTNTVAIEGSEEDYLETYPIELRPEPITVIANAVAIEGTEEDDPKTYAIELRSEPIIVSTNAVATEGSEEDDSETYPTELRSEPIVASTNAVATQGSEEEDDPETYPIELRSEHIIFSTNAVATEGSEEEYLRTYPEPINVSTNTVGIEGNEEDDPKTYPIELRSESIVVSTNTVAIEGSEDGSATVVPQDRSLTVQGSQEFSEANLIEKKSVIVQGRQEESSNLIEVLEESEECSEISSSEIESENCMMMMSKSYISTEGSEESSETASSEFVAAQAKQEDTSQASKKIVVVMDESEEHEVKVQVEPKSADGGLHQKTKNKNKKPRLADAVAKVTMQKRVISMWVPRAKQPTPDDTKHKPPVYKWVPKAPASTSEEA